MNNTPGSTMDSFIFGNLEIGGPWTPREREAIAHSAMGGKAKDVARKMGISHWTAQDTMKSAQNRVDAINQRHLIMTGFIKGWIRVRDVVPVVLLCFSVAAASVSDAGEWARRLTRRPEEVAVVTATA